MATSLSSISTILETSSSLGEVTSLSQGVFFFLFLSLYISFILSLLAFISFCICYCIANPILSLMFFTCSSDIFWFWEILSRISSCWLSFSRARLFVSIIFIKLSNRSFELVFSFANLGFELAVVRVGLVLQISDSSIALENLGMLSLLRGSAGMEQPWFWMVSMFRCWRIPGSNDSVLADGFYLR